MPGADARPVLVVLAGPQASGKSTLAAALGDELRRRGGVVAVVALDDVAAMALPTLPDWGVALAVFESVVAQWSRLGPTHVVAEGVGNRAEVDRLRATAPEGAAVVTVLLTVPFEAALLRALADPTRTRSRDREFLSGVYREWAAELARIDADLVLETDRRSVEECVERVCAAIEAASGRAPGSGAGAG